MWFTCFAFACAVPEEEQLKRVRAKAKKAAAQKGDSFCLLFFYSVVHYTTATVVLNVACVVVDVPFIIDALPIAAAVDTNLCCLFIHFAFAMAASRGGCSGLVIVCEQLTAAAWG